MHKRALVQALTLPTIFSPFSFPRAPRAAIVIGFSFRDRAKIARWKYITGSQLQPVWRPGYRPVCNWRAHTVAPGTDSSPVVPRKDTYGHLLRTFHRFQKSPLILLSSSLCPARKWEHRNERNLKNLAFRIKSSLDLKLDHRFTQQVMSLWRTQGDQDDFIVSRHHDSVLAKQLYVFL